MKRVIITFLCLLCIVQAYSQSFTISGTIIDGESNEPLIGAGILVKGAGRGTITNIDGKYSLEVKRGRNIGIFVCGLSKSGSRNNKSAHTEYRIKGFRSQQPERSCYHRSRQRETYHSDRCRERYSSQRIT